MLVRSRDARSYNHTTPHRCQKLAPSSACVARECYAIRMYAQTFHVDVLIRGERKPCPLEWLDQFCMRNFTNAAEFDDTLPLADGSIEASFRLTPERFGQGLAAWLTQRGKGEGQPVQVEVHRLEATHPTTAAQTTTPANSVAPDR